MLITTYLEGWQSGSVRDLNRPWPNTTIPYTISVDYGNLSSYFLQ